MRRKKRIIFFKFILCALLTGIFSTGSAYYNTFFNAKKEFNAAAKERKKRKDDKATSQENGHYNQRRNDEKILPQRHEGTKKKFYLSALVSLWRLFVVSYERKVKRST